MSLSLSLSLVRAGDTDASLGPENAHITPATHTHTDECNRSLKGLFLCPLQAQVPFHARLQRVSLPAWWETLEGCPGQDGREALRPRGALSVRSYPRALGRQTWP